MSRRRQRALPLLAALVVFAPACTSDTAQFCEKLRDVYDLSELSEAIAAVDVRGINAALEDLRAVEDTAPEEIFEDFRHLVNVLEDTVRIVTDVSDSDGLTTPVDPSTLTDQLSKIAEPAQKVADYADKYCGIELGS